MQAAFFKLANVLPVEEAVKYLKEFVEKTYGRKGEQIVQLNYQAIDRGIEGLVKVDVPDHWANVEEVEEEDIKDEPEFIKRIHRPMARHDGDDLPTSAFKAWRMEPSPWAPLPMKTRHSPYDTPVAD